MSTATVFIIQLLIVMASDVAALVTALLTVAAPVVTVVSVEAALVPPEVTVAAPVVTVVAAVVPPLVTDDVTTLLEPGQAEGQVPPTVKLA